MCKSILVRATAVWMVALIAAQASAQNKAPNNAGPQPKAAPGSADQQAIEALKSAFVNAYNAGKADGIAAIFSDDARVTDEDGVTIEGRKAVADRYTETFKQNPGSKIELKSVSLRFLSPDVAIAEGEAVVHDAERPALGDAAKQPANPPQASAAQAESSAYTAIFVKKDGRWSLSMLRDHPAPAASAPTPHERLQDLKWMVGEWVEEGPEAISTSSCKWDDSGNFLVWKYKLQNKNANASGGTTYIGWDPLTKQITSWVFDSEGGHGEATWSRLADDQWMAKASGILSDGRTASATQYIKQLGPDRASWTSLDRVAGGEPVPNISEYVLVRRPQQASINGNSPAKAAMNPAASNPAAAAVEKR
jgi:uncharacterized protein (TIGR02246 family)